MSVSPVRTSFLQLVLIWLNCFLKRCQGYMYGILSQKAFFIQAPGFLYFCEIHNLIQLVYTPLQNILALTYSMSVMPRILAIHWLFSMYIFIMVSYKYHFHINKFTLNNWCICFLGISEFLFNWVQNDTILALKSEVIQGKFKTYQEVS